MSTKTTPRQELCAPGNRWWNQYEPHSAQPSNEKSTREQLTASDVPTTALRAASDQVRKGTSSKKKKKTLLHSKMYSGKTSLQLLGQREEWINPLSQQTAEQLLLKGTTSRSSAHHSPIRVSWDNTTAVGGPGGQLVIGSRSWKHPWTIETTWHQSPSKPKVSADPAFNSASYINQTRCSEQWLTLVSQFPPTMSAPLVVTQFVSIICSLVASGSFIFHAPLPSERCPTAVPRAGTPQNAHQGSSVFGSHLAIPGVRAAPPLPNPSGSVLALSSEHDIVPCRCSVKQKEPAIPIYNINEEMG